MLYNEEKVSNLIKSIWETIKLFLPTSSEDAVVDVFHRAPTPRPLNPRVDLRFALQEPENDVQEHGDVHRDGEEPNEQLYAAFRDPQQRDAKRSLAHDGGEREKHVLHPSVNLQPVRGVLRFGSGRARES